MHFIPKWPWRLATTAMAISVIGGNAIAATMGGSDISDLQPPPLIGNAEGSYDSANSLPAGFYDGTLTLQRQQARKAWFTKRAAELRHTAG